MQKYVCGFLFSPDHKKVVLITKNRPEFQAGKLNGVGGKIEENETPNEAMYREFHEETGRHIPSQNWTSFANNSAVRFFYAVSKEYFLVQTKTDETLGIYSVDSLEQENIVCDINSLIDTAIDDIEYLENKFPLKDNWISCKDKLPDNYERVLIFLHSCKGGLIFEATHGYVPSIGFVWQKATGGSFLDYELITHWQPRPKLPKDITERYRDK